MAPGADAGRAVFDPLRPQLAGSPIACSGSVADAEDVVQDAFLRWLGADRGAVREPEAFLRRVVTRLCLDQLKSARAPARDLCRPVAARAGASRPSDGRGRRRHAAADAGARTAVAAGARRLPAARRVRRRLRRGRADHRPRRRRRAGSSPAARAAMSAPRGRASRVRRSTGWRSPRPSSPPRATATWRRCARCWPTTSSLHSRRRRQAAGGAEAAVSASTTCCSFRPRSRACSPRTGRASRALRHRSTACRASSPIDADGTLQTTALDIATAGSPASTSCAIPTSWDRSAASPG